MNKEHNADHMRNPRHAVTALAQAAKAWVETPEDGQLPTELMNVGQSAWNWLHCMGHDLLAEVTVMSTGMALDEVEQATTLMGILASDLTDEDMPMLEERLHLEACLQTECEK